jgi:uncharacterized iron-regulated membrane protein
MKLRQLLFQVHLYAGLIVGLLLAVIGLSGSALVFGDELDRVLHPALRRVVPAGTPAPLAQVIAAVAESQGGRLPRHLRVPGAEDVPLEAWMDSHGELKVYVNPYSAEVLGTRSAGQSLVGSLRSLHVSLFAGRVGERLVGVSGLTLIALCLSGLGLWWPGSRKLSAGLSLRRPLRWRRANHDLHKLGGLVSLVVLLLAGLTGAALVFPAPFEQALRLAAGAPPRSAPPAPGPSTGEPLPLDVLLAQADQAMPGARTTRIDLPSSPNEALRVRKRFPQEPHPNGMSFVHVDPHGGGVLRAESALEAAWPARLMALRYPLHIGTLGGAATRLLAVLTGLFPAGLFLPGFFLWMARLRARPEPVPRPNLSLIPSKR